MDPTWSASLSTGIPSIDSEHFDFVRRVDDVLEGHHGLRTVEGALNLLAYLENLVLHHFIEEEQQMLAVDYPDVLNHRGEHGRLAEHVISARHRIAADPRDLEVLVVSNRLLCTWLLGHLNSADRDFADYMRRHRRRFGARS